MMMPLCCSPALGLGSDALEFSLTSLDDAMVVHVDAVLLVVDAIEVANTVVFVDAVMVIGLTRLLCMAAM